MKMKLVANLLIMLALGLVVIGILTRFLGITILFPDINPISYIIIANTFLLLALILKIANE